MAKQDLSNKVLLITGGSSGIGRAAALMIAERGGRVALGARREEVLQTVAQEVQARGGDALAVPTDVTDRKQVEHLVNQTVERWGRIDVVISNAGQYVQVPILEMSLADLECAMAVNFYGHIHLIQAALPLLVAQRSGHVILIASMDAKKGIPPDAPYVSAKYALAGFGEVLRQEMRPHGIAVTTIFPGRVDTAMIGALTVPSISAKIPPETVARAIIRAVHDRPAEVLIPPGARLLNLVNFLSPRLADWAVKKLRLAGWERD